MKEEDFLRKLKSALDEEASRLDHRVLHRLQMIRLKALEAEEVKRVSLPFLRLPVLTGSLAAITAVLISFLLWQNTHNEKIQFKQTEDIEVLSLVENMDFYENVDLYESFADLDIEKGT